MFVLKLMIQPKTDLREFGDINAEWMRTRQSREILERIGEKSANVAVGATNENQRRRNANTEQLDLVMAGNETLRENRARRMKTISGC